jgi:hypothetical protein
MLFSISSTGWPLRLLFPLACPLPPLLRLLPTPAGARFYSPSRLSTSLVTPTSRRPINRHGLLSRTYIPNQASHTKPTIEEIKEWDEDDLLEWIQQKRPKLLKDDDLRKLKAARISGQVFLICASNVGFFKNRCNLPIGTSYELADLAMEVAGGETAGRETAGIKSKFLSFIPCTPRGRQANNLTGLSKVDAEEAFKAGIKYTPPDPLLATSGVNWVYQPHPDLYETLATNVLEHYAHYKRDEINKTYTPTYFYLGGAGTGKSRHASEFASSVQKAITLRTQHPLYHDLAQRLKTAFVFHISFENGTPPMKEEMSDLWNAIGVRMLHQVIGKPFNHIRRRYIADPSAVFRLVAAAENINVYDDFIGIMVIDGIQRTLNRHDDGRNSNSAFYRLLDQISLMSRSPSEAKGLRKAPFIMTCVTAICSGPVNEFFADSHHSRIHLPLNRLDAPTWKKDNSPVLNDSPATRLFVKDVGGHPRAIELIADQLTEYQNKVQPNITELANAIYAKLMDRYAEAVVVLECYDFPIVQCILSRQQIRLRDVIPGSDLRWENVIAPGLIWFERSRKNYDSPGYLIAPYIWFWMLARLRPSEDTERLCQFLGNWQFNDYAELLRLTTGEGPPGNTTWQSFEAFCYSFRILRSLGFKDGQEVPLRFLHSGCKLRDDQETMVVNRHLDFAQAVHQYRTDSIARSHAATEEVDTRHSGTLDAGAQLSHVIPNGTGAVAGDFFLNIEMAAQRSPKEKGSQGKIIREVGQCKLIRKKFTQATYNAERNKSAGPDDIFMLYTKTEISDDCALPDRSGLVDASCWDSYFGPFASRAFLALQYSGSEGLKNDQT